MPMPRVRSGYVVLVCLGLVVLGFFAIRRVAEATSDASAADPVRTLAGVEAPAQGWVDSALPSSDVLDSEARGFASFQDEDGVWQDDGGGRYLVSYAARVGPDDVEQRCAEAAAWLVEVGQGLPGDVVAGADPAPTADGTASLCRRLAEGPESAATGSDAFGGWPNTTSGDVQYGPWLELEFAGGRTTLHASVAAISSE